LKVPEKDLPQINKPRIAEEMPFNNPTRPPVLKTYGRKRKDQSDLKSTQSVPGVKVTEHEGGDSVHVTSSPPFEEEIEICPEQLFNTDSFSNQVSSSNFKILFTCIL